MCVCMGEREWEGVMDGDGVEAVDVAALLLPHTTLRRDVFTQEYDIQYELYARRLPSLRCVCVGVWVHTSHTHTC